MFNTFLQAAKVHKAYRANAFIYHLKKFPLIGALIKSREYGGGLIKVLANLSFYISGIFKFCIFDWLYLATVFILSAVLKENLGMPLSSTFPLIILAFLPVGIFLNNTIFSTEADKYYDIIIFRMNASKLALSTLYYNLLRMLVGYITAFFVICKLSDISALTAILITLAAILGKFAGINYRTECTMKQHEKKFIKCAVLFILTSLLIVASLLFTRVVVPTVILQLIFAIIAIIGLIFVPKVVFFKDYLQLYKYYLKEDNVFVNEKSQNVTKEAAKNNITFEEKDKKLDTNKVSNKSGFAYFNELFVLRHKGLLARKTKILCIISAAVWGMVLGVCIFAKATGEAFTISINTAYKGLLLIPIFMYYINQGDGLVQAMFFNCDNAMLTYNFYRKSENILGVFKQRLKTIMYYNLIIAGVISLEGITIAPLVTSESYLKVVVIAVVLIFTSSILFSMHKLVLYYILQPFTDGVTVVKPMWTMVNTITYIVCFSLAQLMEEINPTIALYIAIGFIVFSFIYFIVALALVRKLAPSRFKLNR